MSENFRHHRASREIVFVAVPVPAAGSPEPFPHRPPPKYPQQHHQPWRPQRSIPSKANATACLLRQIAANEMAAREMLTPQALRRG
jgi:hypothetical protein